MNVNDIKSPENIGGDKLEIIFAEQQKLMEKYHEIERVNGFLQTPDVPVNMDDSKGQARLKDFAWRITEELAEALDALSSRQGNIAIHAQEEIADAFHFLVEFSILADIFPNPRKDLEAPGMDTLDLLFKSRGLITTKPPNPTLHVMSFIKDLGMTCHLLKNKPWKQSQVLTDVEEFRRRFFIVINKFIDICITFGMDSHSLFDLYFRKNKVNQFRQRSGY